jgi:hypothetical protein
MFTIPTIYVMLVGAQSLGRIGDTIAQGTGLLQLEYCLLLRNKVWM